MEDHFGKSETVTLLFQRRRQYQPYLFAKRYTTRYVKQKELRKRVGWYKELGLKFAQRVEELHWKDTHLQRDDGEEAWALDSDNDEEYKIYSCYHYGDMCEECLKYRRLMLENPITGVRIFPAT